MGRKAYALVPVVLVSLVALNALGCSGSQAQSSTPYRAVASVDEVMDGIVIPSSQTIFDAVVYSNGELVQSPRSDDDWFNLRISAMAVAESGNLLMMPTRAKDGEDWSTFARAMTDAAVDVAKAADSKDIDRVLQTGSLMYTACTNCHEKYLEDPPQ